MRLPRLATCTAALLVAGALLTGCSSDDDSPDARPSSSPSGPVDPFVALDPPTSPGVGSIDPVVAQRAHDATQGLLALTLAEPGSITGSDPATLVEGLAVPDASLGVADLLQPPTRRGLDVRPLFARGVTLDAHPVEVVRSSYSAEEVRGLAGEQAVRITWDGAVRYRVLLAGVPRQVAYALHVSYVFALIPEEPGGIRLAQVVPGSSHAAPVVSSCLAKGVLLPSEGQPSSSDFGPGPWPAPPAGQACPV
jgi:hypothetical protein